MANEKRLIAVEDVKSEIWNTDCDVFEFCDGCVTNMGISRVELDDAIDRVPTVDAVEVVHAEWLDGYAVDHNGKKVYDSIDCSHCNDIFKIKSHDREYWKGRFKVCPFCGAIMDGGNEDG